MKLSKQLIQEFPDINNLTVSEAISWYTKQVAEVTNAKNRVAGTYTADYRKALLSWKKELNRKVLEARSALYKQ